MSKSEDPDNPSSRRIETLSREAQMEELLEQESTQNSAVDAVSLRTGLTEPTEVNTTGTDLETGRVPRDMEDEVRTDREAQPVRGEGVYSPILDEIEDVLGYDPDSGQPMLTGQIEDIQVNQDEINLVYTVKEPLIDTSTSRITAPAIEQVDQSVTRVAYDRENLEVDIDVEDGYEVTLSYEGQIKDAATEMARALAEFEDEINNAYQLETE